MPRQWHALMQDSRRIRIKGCSVRCHAFSPWITAASQNIIQTNTIQNTYLYYVVDHSRLLPGYNVESGYYSQGRSDLFGLAVLAKWIIPAEPYVEYRGFNSATSSASTYGFDQMSVDLFNHPNFSLLKQTEELSVSWSNDAEDEWFHTAMPWATNHDFDMLNSYPPTRHGVWAINNGYTTKFCAPNVTWGGNPSVIPNDYHHLNNEKETNDAYVHNKCFWFKAIFSQQPR